MLIKISQALFKLIGHIDLLHRVRYFKMYAKTKKRLGIHPKPLILCVFLAKDFLKP